MAQIRQGDIVLDKVASDIKEWEKWANTRGLVIAEVKSSATVGFGEGSGHSHVVTADEVQTVLPETATPDMLNKFLLGEGEALADDFFMYVIVREPGQIVHEDASGQLTKDHNPLEVEPGVYQVKRQTEYDEKLHGRRYVAD